jgi:hypothetical protein
MGAFSPVRVRPIYAFDPDLAVRTVTIRAATGRIRNASERHVLR